MPLHRQGAVKNPLERRKPPIRINGPMPNTSRTTLARRGLVSD